jgi:hypothetical protein
MTRGIVVKILHYDKITSTCNPVLVSEFKRKQIHFLCCTFKTLPEGTVIVLHNDEYTAYTYLWEGFGLIFC